MQPLNWYCSYQKETDSNGISISNVAKGRTYFHIESKCGTNVKFINYLDEIASRDMA